MTEVPGVPGVRHRWYGSEDVIDEWWPAALEAWQRALAARADEVPADPAI